MMTPAGVFIAEKRSFRRMTQVELALAVGVTSAYICRVESGLKRPTNPEFLEKVASALRLSDIEKRAFQDLVHVSQRSVQLPDNTPLRGYKMVTTLASCLPRLTERQLVVLDSIIEQTCRDFCNHEQEEETM